MLDKSASQLCSIVQLLESSNFDLNIATYKYV
jgi:hypothetical protein